MDRISSSPLQPYILLVYMHVHVFTEAADTDYTVVDHQETSVKLSAFY
jgi:hypothetical protein